MEVPRQGEAARGTRLTLTASTREEVGRGFIVARGRVAQQSDTRVMTRVRYDPSFITHPRWEDLGADAYVMHSGACSYVVEHLTDGLISRAAAMRLPLVRNPRKTLNVLVSSGMWTDCGGDTFLVCQCLDDLRTAAGRGDEQPSKASVDAYRTRKQQNKQEWQAKKKPGKEPGREPGSKSGSEPGSVPGSEPRTTHYDPLQRSSGTFGSVPELLADTDAVCEHGTPNGRLLTRAGDPRCPMCRRAAMKLVPEETA